MPVADDWSYTLGHHFLDAAVSCGATCQARRLVEWGSPMVPCTGDLGCPCSLTVEVLEGLFRPAGAVKGTCVVQRTAQIQLTLSMCRTLPETDGYVDLIASDGQIRDHATTRWQILRGLWRAWQAGELCAGPCADFPPGASGGCERFTPGPWLLAEATDACTRWRSLWGYSSDII